MMFMGLGTALVPRYPFRISEIEDVRIARHDVRVIHRDGNVTELPRVINVGLRQRWAAAENQSRAAVLEQPRRSRERWALLGHP